MLRRRALPIVALCVLAGCKSSGDASKAGAVDFDQRCSQLAKACSQQDRHIEKVFDGCKELGAKPADVACTDKLVALYDCYQKQVCGGSDKVWAFDDLRVLAERHKVCTAESKAFTACTQAKK
jgi:hypothetical protein